MTFTAFTNQVADPISVYLGIITAAPIFWFWYEFTIGSHKRRRKWFEQVRNQPGDRPGILTMDLLDKSDIRPQVENFRMQDNALKEVPSERIEFIGHDGDIRSEEMPDIVRKVQEKGTVFRAQGVDTLHLFYAGPVTPLACVGALFSNSFRVILYQRNRAGKYENWGPLKHDYV